jgi:hypothetical protein
VSVVRTLVLGIPLPHVTFDNYSFISAPALSEYERLIVDTAAASTVVEEVAAGSADHRNFAGQPVHNGSRTATAFSLADLLQMRRREASWFFSRKALAVSFAHPDVAHPSVAVGCEWRRYAWLPAPSGFSYTDHLLPGFGTPGGAQITDENHPFAPFLRELAPRVAYRATLDEAAPDFADYGRVFARSRGGAAIAAEITIERGSIILLPPLVDPQADRSKVAQILYNCIERWCEQQSAEGQTG